MNDQRELGELVADTAASPAPLPGPFVGKHVTLVAFDPPVHGPPLFEEIKNTPQLWDYMLSGPFQDVGAYVAALHRMLETLNLYAILDNHAPQPSLAVKGHLALMRMDLPNRVGEVGTVLFAPSFQRSIGSTECIFLVMQTAFEDLKLRRFEWKCNSLNVASNRAALRLGFTFEGTFRKHMLLKGRNRDTNWYSIIDDDWPILKAVFTKWLADDNFDEGRQKKSLAEVRQSLP